MKDFLKEDKIWIPLEKFVRRIFYFSIFLCVFLYFLEACGFTARQARQYMVEKPIKDFNKIILDIKEQSARGAKFTILWDVDGFNCGRDLYLKLHRLGYIFTELNSAPGCSQYCHGCIVYWDLSDYKIEGQTKMKAQSKKLAGY